MATYSAPKFNRTVAQPQAHRHIIAKQKWNKKPMTGNCNHFNTTTTTKSAGNCNHFNTTTTKKALALN